MWATLLEPDLEGGELTGECFVSGTLAHGARLEKHYMELPPEGTSVRLRCDKLRERPGQADLAS